MWLELFYELVSIRSWAEALATATFLAFLFVVLVLI